MSSSTPFEGNSRDVGAIHRNKKLEVVKEHTFAIFPNEPETIEKLLATEIELHEASPSRLSRSLRMVNY
jgi:hypothetical protein